MPSFLILEVIPKINKKFLITIKVLIVNQVLKLFDNIKWSYNTEIISKEELYDSGFFKDKRFGLNFDDEYSGTYNGVDFRVGDSRYFGEQAYDKEKIIYIGKYAYYEKTGINAVLLLFKSQKTIKDNVIITEKRSWKDHIFTILLNVFAFIGVLIAAIDQCIKEYSYLPLIFPILFLVLLYNTKFANKSKKSKVITEDVEFLRRFNIKANDQVEARYLMTTSFMDRFNNLRTAFKSKKVDCYCWEDNVLFVISTNKNIFEFANVYKPLTNTDEINNFFEEINSIYQIIDYFNFNSATRL